MTARYLVQFERIGRTRPGPLAVTAANEDVLANKIAEYGRKFLRSRDFEVAVDMDAGEGNFVCGFHNGGDFKFREVKDQ